MPFMRSPQWCPKDRRNGAARRAAAGAVGSESVMDAHSERWRQITPSAFPWEREAQDFVREGLPDHEPYRAWASFEFIENSAIGEVDLLVCSPVGLFLVEIKSWPGHVDGDAGTWTNTRPNGRARPFDN